MGVRARHRDQRHPFGDLAALGRRRELGRLERRDREDRDQRPVRGGQPDHDDAPGDDPVLLRIAEAVENELFVDEAVFGDLLLRTTHRIDRIDGDRIRVVYRMEITGAGADETGPRIGPAITADWPDTMASLAELALR